MLASSHVIAHVVLAILAVVVAIVYFLPTIVAVARKHHWIPRIFVVNALLGWTVVGWIVAFHMASTSRTKTQAYWKPNNDVTAAGGSHVPVQLNESGKAPAPSSATVTYAPPAAPSPTAGGAPATPPPSAAPTWKAPPAPASGPPPDNAGEATPRPSGTFGLPTPDSKPGELG